MKKNTYIFNHFTGYGIGEISAHTINFYPIEINAFNFEDALILYNKKKLRVKKYNNCYRQSTILVIKYENNITTVGIFWTNSNIIKWQGEKVYWSPLTYDHPFMTSFIFPTTDYPSHDVHFTNNYCNGKVIPSYTYWFEQLLIRYPKNTTSLFSNLEEDTKKHYCGGIEYLLNKCISKLTIKEIEEIEQLLNKEI